MSRWWSNAFLHSGYVERRCSIICGALVFVGTRLNQKSDAFKVTILSCYVERRCSMICGALVFVGTGLNQKSDNFKETILSCYKQCCYANKDQATTDHGVTLLLRDLWWFGLCWHRTQPEIGQLQGHIYELLQTMVLLHHLWWLGLCWHQSQPEIGRLQGHHSELLCKELLPHHLSVLGLVLHLLLSVKICIWDFRWRLPHTRASLYVVHSRHWDFVAGSSAAQEACHHLPHMPLWCPHLAPRRQKLQDHKLYNWMGLIVIQWAVALKDS